MDNTISRIKIALIPDEKGWAFDNIAKQIKKNLNYYYEFTIIPYEKYLYSPAEFCNTVKDCHILHFFWRDTIRDMQLTKCAGWDLIKDKIISTAVYDHLLLSKEDVNERTDLFQSTYYYVCSEKLKQIYDNIEGYKKPIMIIEDGVDPTLFYPMNTDRFNSNAKLPLKIGWTGNSSWDLDYDLKGFKTYIKPAVKRLKKSGYSIKGVFRDGKNRYIPHNKMIDFYSKIDILVCMSLSEGTPNPILEAMACGVPVITTDVGIVPQVFGEKQKNFILKDRDINTLMSAIIKLYKHRDIMQELSQENLAEIKDWYWSKQCLKFKEYFDVLSSYL